MVWICGGGNSPEKRRSATIKDWSNGIHVIDSILSSSSSSSSAKKTNDDNHFLHNHNVLLNSYQRNGLLELRATILSKFPKCGNNNNIANSTHAIKSISNIAVEKNNDGHHGFPSSSPSPSVENNDIVAGAQSDGDGGDNNEGEQISNDVNNNIEITVTTSNSSSSKQVESSILALSELQQQTRHHEKEQEQEQSLQSYSDNSNYDSSTNQTTSTFDNNSRDSIRFRHSRRHINNSSLGNSIYSLTTTTVATSAAVVTASTVPHTIPKELFISNNVTSSFLLSEYGGFEIDNNSLPQNRSRRRGSTENWNSIKKVIGTANVLRTGASPPQQQGRLSPQRTRKEIQRASCRTKYSTLTMDIDIMEEEDFTDGTDDDDINPQFSTLSFNNNKNYTYDDDDDDSAGNNQFQYLQQPQMRRYSSLTFDGDPVPQAIKNRNFSILSFATNNNPLLEEETDESENDDDNDDGSNAVDNVDPTASPTQNNSSNNISSSMTKKSRLPFLTKEESLKMSSPIASFQNSFSSVDDESDDDDDNDDVKEQKDNNNNAADNNTSGAVTTVNTTTTSSATNNKNDDIPTPIATNKGTENIYKRVNDNGNNSNNEMKKAPDEWYELSLEDQTTLYTKYLSWDKLMSWDEFNIFHVSELCNGQPILFVGWAILGSPHSQRIMKQTISPNGGRENNDNNDGNRPTLLRKLSSKKKEFYNKKVTNNVPPPPFGLMDLERKATPLVGNLSKMKLKNATNDDNKEVEEETEGVGYNFMELYRIPWPCLLNMLRSVENHYHSSNPFHNNIHAADVLQTSHYFLTQLCGVAGSSSSSPSLPGITKLQCFALLVSAIVHDVGHPALSNNFQTNAFTALALRYNDTSILENYHLSLAFKVIFSSTSTKEDVIIEENKQQDDDDEGSLACKKHSDETKEKEKDKIDLNIFQNMRLTDFQECRKMMIAAVLGTDLANHFKDLEKIVELPNKKEWMNLVPMDDNDVDDDDTRYSHLSWMILKFLLHVADISNNAKPNHIATEWTDRIMDEFFYQGDQEKLYNLPISPLCDRDNTSIPESQMGFINFIIRPSYQALEKHFGGNSSSSSSNNDNDPSSLIQKILSQIETNFQFWKQRKEEEETKLY